MWMLIKRLSRIGNSQGILLDKVILDMVGIGMETDLEIRADGKQLVIRPVPAGKARGDVMASYRHVAKKHAATLRKLAK